MTIVRLFSSLEMLFYCAKVSNPIKFTGGGPLSFQCKLSVEFQTQNIDQDNPKRIFYPFYS